MSWERRVAIKNSDKVTEEQKKKILGVGEL